MASSSTSKTITLKSNDGEEFLVSEMVALQFQTICHMIKDEYARNTIPVPNVNAKNLAKVIQYCERHIDAAHLSKTETIDEDSSTKLGSSKITDRELEKWDRQFLDVDRETIFDIMFAAHFMGISKLLDATWDKVVNMIREEEEIRKIFNIDFTLEEKEEIRRENQ